MYNFEMRDSLQPCSESNKNLKQIDYLMLAVHFARRKSGLSTHTMFAMLPIRKAWKMMAGKKHLRRNHWFIKTISTTKSSI